MTTTSGRTQSAAHQDIFHPNVLMCYFRAHPRYLSFRLDSAIAHALNSGKFKRETNGRDREDSREAFVRYVKQRLASPDFVEEIRRQGCPDAANISVETSRLSEWCTAMRKYGTAQNKNKQRKPPDQTQTAIAVALDVRWSWLAHGISDNYWPDFLEPGLQNRPHAVDAIVGIHLFHMLFTNAISPAFHITQGIHPDTGVGFSPIYGREMRAADKDHWVQNAREVPFIHEQCKRAIEEHYDEIAQPESMLSDDFLLRKSDRIRHVIETARAWASKRAREKPRERPILSLGKADEVGIAEALLWYLSLPDQVDSSVLFPLAANPHDASRAVQRTPIGQRPSAPASMATATAVAQQHPPVEKRSRIGVFEHKATARAEVPATLKPQ